MIKILPDQLVNQIAAGEVVDRPSSVVRELVDNAVDAGSTDILVAIDNGGHSRIRVLDNGSGMSKDDALLAFERHATSKVSSIEELFSLTTLGFRGEALASIAAVAKVRMVTKELDSPSGTEVVIRGGKLVNVSQVAWGGGTEIEIEHLFFNTPARRKFLKSPRSEIARIRGWLSHNSVCRPQIRFRLICDGDEVLNLSPATSVAERARQIFPSGMTPVSLTESGISVSGMVAHPGEAIADMSGFVIIINGRLVSDRLVARAIREGFDSMLKAREFPLGYLSISVPPEFVDINVHPQKSEVRFRHADAVFAVVRGAVLTAVRTMRRPLSYESPALNVVSGPQSLSSQISYTTQNLFSEGGNIAAASTDVSYTAKPSYYSAPISSTSSAGITVQHPNGFSTPSANSGLPAFQFSDLRYVGQILQCYLLCELNQKLVVIDMHAAHERVNYNKIRNAYKSRESSSERVTPHIQRLLIDEVISLPESQIVTLLEHEEILESLGFEMRQVSASQVAVSGVPAVISHLNVRGLFCELAAESVPETWKERLSERIDHMAARLACHASIRSGDLLSRDQAYALFSQLDNTELSAACPHGRPVVAEFSKGVIESWFGRDR